MVKEIKLKIIVVIIGLLLNVSCGTNYYYTEGGGLRSKNKTMPVPKNYKADYSKIDVNSIYLEKDREWFFKFYPDNKVGYMQLKGAVLTESDLDSKKGKMGYFTIDGDQLTTYIFINRGIKTYNKKTYRISNDTIYDAYGNYVREKIELKNIEDLKPDW